MLSITFFYTAIMVTMSIQSASAGVSWKGVSMSDLDFGCYIDSRIPFSQTKRLDIIHLNPVHVSKRKNVYREHAQ